METTIVESHGLEDLVFGLVAPIGTDLNSVSSAMSNTLRGMGYDTNVIQLSSLLTEIKDRFQLTRELSPHEWQLEPNVRSALADYLVQSAEFVAESIESRLFDPPQLTIDLSDGDKS